MASIRKSLALSFAGKYSSMAIHMVSAIVLARLLTPEEIGIYSVGAAVVALAHTVRDFGVGAYLIQERELTRERIRTAFGVALVIAWLMAAALFALSDPVSSFYDEPGLRQVLRVLSLTFLVIPFSSPVLALLQRDMAFGKLYMVGLASAIAHVSTGITLAALGYGFMSLAWASLAGVVATATVAAVYRPSIARLLPSFKEWRRIGVFGGMLSAANVFGQIGFYAPDLILGRLLGFTAVGLFSRAMGLIQIFNRTVMHAIMPVVMPVFAAKHRRSEDLVVPYLKGLSYVTVLAWPFFVFLGFMAYPIIRILFGNQWDAAVPIVQILCLAGIFRPLWYFVPSLLISLGKVKMHLEINAICNTLFAAFIFFGALHSLKAAAFAPSLFCFVYFAVSYIYMRDLIRISLWDVLGAVSKSFAVAVLCALVPGAFFFGMNTGPDNIWQSLVLALSGTTLVWVAAIFAINHPIRKEVSLFGQKLRGAILALRATST